MNRRGFFGTVIGCMAGLLGLGTAAKAEPHKDGLTLIQLRKFVEQAELQSQCPKCKKQVTHLYVHSNPGRNCPRTTYWCSRCRVEWWYGDDGTLYTQTRIRNLLVTSVRSPRGML